MASNSRVELMDDDWDDDEAAFLAVEDDDDHPYVHFPHCKVYLVLTLGLVVVTTLMVPLAIGYARPALKSYEFQPAQCSVAGIDWTNDDDAKKIIKPCPSKTKGRDAFLCPLQRARCDFASIPLCFQRNCRCLRVNVTATFDGKESKEVPLYDYEDIYLNYPLCTVNPCGDDEDFKNLINKIVEQNNFLRCFHNGHAAILNPKYRDGGATVFGALVLPLILFVVWLSVSAYVVKRTWRVMRRDFKHAVEFRFNSWPPRPHASVRASVYGDDGRRSIY